MIYVSSDWHGVALSKIKALLSSAEFSSEDFLFVLGDVIDRGEHGVELLRWMMLQPNVELILGNHEAMLLSCDFLFEEITDESAESVTSEKLSLLRTWQFNGAEPTLKALAREDFETRADIVEYLREAPLYDSVHVNDRDYLLVHAGLGNYSADKRIGDYKPEELFFVRPELSTRYSSDFITVLGHTPTLLYGEEHRGKMLGTETWLNIDTGAACGLSPMLLRLDDGKEYYLS